MSWARAGAPGPARETSVPEGPPCRAGGRGPPPGPEETEQSDATEQADEAGAAGGSEGGEEAVAPGGTGPPAAPPVLRVSVGAGVAGGPPWWPRGGRCPGAAGGPEGARPGAPGPARPGRGAGRTEAGACGGVSRGANGGAEEGEPASAGPGSPPGPAPGHPYTCPLSTPPGGPTGDCWPSTHTSGSGSGDTSTTLWCFPGVRPVPLPHSGDRAETAPQPTRDPGTAGFRPRGHRGSHSVRGSQNRSRASGRAVQKPRRNDRSKCAGVMRQGGEGGTATEPASMIGTLSRAPFPVFPCLSRFPRLSPRLLRFPSVLPFLPRPRLGLGATPVSPATDFSATSASPDFPASLGRSGFPDLPFPGPPRTSGAGHVRGRSTGTAAAASPSSPLHPTSRPRPGLRPAVCGRFRRIQEFRPPEAGEEERRTASGPGPEQARPFPTTSVRLYAPLYDTTALRE
jgi:hypothetical protein